MDAQARERRYARIRHLLTGTVASPEAGTPLYIQHIITPMRGGCYHALSRSNAQVLAGESGDERYAVQPLFLFVLAAIKAGARSALPQEYGLTVGGIQRYKRLTLLNHFACVLIMLEPAPADFTMRAWRNWQTRET